MRLPRWKITDLEEEITRSGRDFVACCYSCSTDLKVGSVLTWQYCADNYTKMRILLNTQEHSETRLTYNCAHLRSTKESLTIRVENFLGENYFE